MTNEGKSFLFSIIDTQYVLMDIPTKIVDFLSTNKKYV